MRKILIAILLLVFVITISGCKEGISSDKEDKNTDEINQIEDGKDDEVVMEKGCKSEKVVYLKQTDTINSEELWFNSKVCDNLKIENSNIKLDNIMLNGTLETSDFFLDPFLELVPSWNVIIDGSSKVSIFVAIGNSDGYSEYFTMALWRDTYKTSFFNEENSYGRTSIDTIIPKLDNIDRIKFKIIFANSDTEATALKNLSITTVPVNGEKNYDYSVLEEREIVVLPRQQLSVPLIGNSICSPTSLSMVLNYYGHPELQSEVAGLVFDKGANIYGNWSFNVSYAGGFEDIFSRVEYTNDLSVLMKYINLNQPVVMSISTQRLDDLEGTIMTYPAGHLLVLTGFKQIENIWYALVSDPAEYEDSNVNREYKLEELLNVWKGYIYVVQTNMFD